MEFYKAQEKIEKNIYWYHSKGDMKKPGEEKEQIRANQGQSALLIFLVRINRTASVGY